MTTTRPLSPAAIGRWSARHPWLAIALWLGFVVACVAALAVTGSKQLHSGATGESARAENMQMAQKGVASAVRVRVPAQRLAACGRPGVPRHGREGAHEP